MGRKEEGIPRCDRTAGCGAKNFHVNNSFETRRDKWCSDMKGGKTPNLLYSCCCCVCVCITRALISVFLPLTLALLQLQTPKTGAARVGDGEGEASQPQGGAAARVQDGVRQELAVRRGRGRGARGPRRVRAYSLCAPGHVEPHSQAQGLVHDMRCFWQKDVAFFARSTRHSQI